jgi:hypothetical protein
MQCFYKLGVLTYFQLNRDYIAEFLCINKEKPITTCYGQCFLKKNLNLTDNPTSDEGAVPKGSQTVEFPVFLIAETDYVFSRTLLTNPSNSKYLLGSGAQHEFRQFRPPSLIL